MPHPHPTAHRPLRVTPRPVPVSPCHPDVPPSPRCVPMRHRARMALHSPPFGAPHPTLLPSARPHALRASPTRTHAPPCSNHAHGPPRPPPSHPGGPHAPLTCHGPHQRVTPLTDTPRAPPASLLHTEPRRVPAITGASPMHPAPCLSYRSHTQSVQHPDKSSPPSLTLPASSTPPPFTVSPGLTRRHHLHVQSHPPHPHMQARKTSLPTQTRMPRRRRTTTTTTTTTPCRPPPDSIFLQHGRPCHIWPPHPQVQPEQGKC